MRQATNRIPQPGFDPVVLTLHTTALDCIEEDHPVRTQWHPVYWEPPLEQTEATSRVDGSTNPDEEPESWVDIVIARTRKLSGMRHGWDGRGSPPPLPSIVKAAEDLLERLRNVTPAGLPDPFVCPVSGGGLQVEMTCGTKHLEIMFDSASSIIFLKEDGTGEEDTDAGELSASDLPSIRGLLNWFGSV